MVIIERESFFPAYYTFQNVGKKVFEIERGEVRKWWISEEVAQY